MNIDKFNHDGQNDLLPSWSPDGQCRYIVYRPPSGASIGHRGYDTPINEFIKTYRASILEDTLTYNHWRKKNEWY